MGHIPRGGVCFWSCRRIIERGRVTLATQHQWTDSRGIQLLLMIFDQSQACVASYRKPKNSQMGFRASSPESPLSSWTLEKSRLGRHGIGQVVET